MRNQKFLLPALVGGAALALTLKTLTGRLTHPKQRPGRTTTGGTSFEEVDAFIEAQLVRLNIPGAALAIIEGDQVVHRRGFGRTRPGGEAPTPQTPFFIGSLTKSFTALAVMQLAEAGKIEIDSPVQRYLPWFRVANLQASAQITIRQLLNQTSSLPTLPGMTGLANFDNRPAAAEHQARALSTLVLKRPPGSQFEYSNLNYNLLGLVIEAASREDYAGYIQRHIFEPLGMRHSYTAKSEARPNGLAAGHRYWFGVPIAAPNLPVPRGSLPSGQLISSVEDMAHYLIAHLNEGCGNGAQILSGAGIGELHRGVAEIVEMGLSFGSYGMGWISQGTGAARIVSHSGIVPDFGAFMAIVPAQKRGLILLFNANHALLKMTLDELGLNAAQLLAGQNPAPPRFAISPGVLRAPLLIPALQMAGVAATLRLTRRWRSDPTLHPEQKHAWRSYILLPLISNLSFASAVVWLCRKGIGGFMRLFMPDLYWTALISAGFAGIWAVLRTGLLLRALRPGERMVP